jgi:two-component sensor histidine kinase
MGEGQDLRGRRKDGSAFPVEIGLNPVEQNGKSATLATVIDISARRKAEDSQRLLINELQHRTRNLFGVFQSIAGNTLMEAPNLEVAARNLDGRIHALAEAYSLIPEFGEGISLATLVRRQLGAHPDRFLLDGCDIVIRPHATQNFALIVHELATNAIKYGALSRSEGKIVIVGTVDRSAGTLVFSWTETGGPPPAPQTRRGFGSVILQDMAQQFSNKVILNFAPEGLHYELHVALREIEAEQGSAAAEVNPSRSAANASLQ